MEYKKIIACVHCGKLLSDGDEIWGMRKVMSDGKEVYSPVCSLECAKAEQAQNASIHRARLYSVENQAFQKTTIKDWDYEVF